MRRFRIALFTALLLPPASLWGEMQHYTITICNRGQFAVDVASGYQDSLFFSAYWRINRWYHVDTGKCSVVYSKNMDLGGGLFRNQATEDHVHLAFAFTDSTGVWGAGMVNPYATNARFGHLAVGKEDLKASSRRFCIHPGNASYNVDGSDPAGGCGGAGTFLVPASIDYAVPPDDIDGHYSATFDVGFSEGDRAIPKGSGPPLDSRIAPSDGDTGASLCGKVSCWDLFQQGLQAARDEEARRATANTNHQPPARRPSANLPPSPAQPATPPPPVDDDDPIGHGGFISRANSTAPASNPVKSLERVRGRDVVAYIDASKSGFAAFKKGDAQISQGLRMWDSSIKPAQAKGCWVVQGTTSTTLSCLLSEQADLNDLRSYYTELTKDIAASLPRDWNSQAEPPFGGDLPNQGYQSSSGAHLEVWIAHAESEAEYQIHFQLVSAN